MLQKSSPALPLAAAAARAEQALKINPSNSVAFQTAAEVHRWRAEWLAAEGRGTRAEIEAGLRQAERALAIDPHQGNALLSKAGLLLIRAESGRTLARRRKAANQAKTLLAHAIAINPLLSRAAAPMIKRAESVK
jgi:hypothetical protein